MSWPFLLPMSWHRTSSSPHRVLRPTGSGGHTSGQGAYIGSGARTRQKWQNHPSRTRTTTRTRTIGGAHAPLMIPKLAESVGPVAILDPLAGPIAHLLAHVYVCGQSPNRFGKISHI